METTRAKACATSENGIAGPNRVDSREVGSFVPSCRSCWDLHAGSRRYARYDARARRIPGAAGNTRSGSPLYAGRCPASQHPSLGSFQLLLSLELQDRNPIGGVDECVVLAQFIFRKPPSLARSASTSTLAWTPGETRKVATRRADSSLRQRLSESSRSSRVPTIAGLRIASL